MAIKDISYIKSRFETGDIPSEQDFVDLIDTLNSYGLSVVGNPSNEDILIYDGTTSKWHVSGKSLVEIDPGNGELENHRDGSKISIGTSNIKDDAITESKIARDAVTLNEIKDFNVINDHLQTKSVSSRVLATDAVETDKIKDGAVTYAKLGNNIFGSKPGDAPRTDADLAKKFNRALLTVGSNIKNLVVRNGNNSQFLKIDSNGAVTTEQYTSKDSVISTYGTGANKGRLYLPDGEELKIKNSSLDLSVVDNLTSTSTTDVLSAKQGKVLDEQIKLIGTHNNPNEPDFYNWHRDVKIDGLADWKRDTKQTFGLNTYEPEDGQFIAVGKPLYWDGWNDGYINWTDSTTTFSVLLFFKANEVNKATASGDVVKLYNSTPSNDLLLMEFKTEVSSRGGMGYDPVDAKNLVVNRISDHLGQASLNVVRFDLQVTAIRDTSGVDAVKDTQRIRFNFTSVSSRHFSKDKISMAIKQYAGYVNASGYVLFGVQKDTTVQIDTALDTGSSNALENAVIAQNFSSVKTNIANLDNDKLEKSWKADGNDVFTGTNKTFYVTPESLHNGSVLISATSFPKNNGLEGLPVVMTYDSRRTIYHTKTVNYDTKPTASSKNLINSGGLYDLITEVTVYRGMAHVVKADPQSDGSGARVNISLNTYINRINPGNTTTLSEHSRDRGRYRLKFYNSRGQVMSLPEDTYFVECTPESRGLATRVVYDRSSNYTFIEFQITTRGSTTFADMNNDYLHISIMKKL